MDTLFDLLIRSQVLLYLAFLLFFLAYNSDESIIKIELLASLKLQVSYPIKKSKLRFFYFFWNPVSANKYFGKTIEIWFFSNENNVQHSMLEVYLNRNARLNFIE